MAKRYNILTRCLAALALFFVYFVSTTAILVGGSTTSAQAQRGRGRGRGYARGYVRGRGYGRGYGYGYYGSPVIVRPGPRCWWNAYGVRVCRW
ncbi:MAG: hypothetical protein PS018_01870 [bacterium]|nr:hypothetical protein [bacterium]